MKNIFKISLLLTLVVCMISCGDDEKIIDDTFDTVERGAVLRTISDDNGPLIVGVGNTFSVEVEEQDIEDGALLDFVDVYVRFLDKTVLSAQSASGAGTDQSFPVDVNADNPEILYPSDVYLRTIPADEFSTDTPFGLPRTVITITEADLAAVLPSGEFDSGDEVEVRLELNLTDGRVFTRGDTAGTVSGDGFYASPYFYTIGVDSGVDINYLDENRNSYVTPDVADELGLDNTYYVQAEITDQDNGNNIAGLEVFRRFSDRTPENGDNSTQEESIMTFSSEDFVEGPNGYPTVDVTITEEELFGDLTAEDVSIDDFFYIRYAVTTVDGRTVTNEIEETNFYDSILVTDCPFPVLSETDNFVGDYLAEQVTQSIFGYDTWDPDGGGVILTLFSEVIDDSQFSAGTELEANQRSFDADYLAPLGGGNFRSYIIEFGLCTVNMVEDAGPIGGFTGWVCDDTIAIVTGPLEEPAGSYNAEDDSEFVLQFFDDYNNSCDAEAQPEIKFIKQ